MWWIVTVTIVPSAKPKSVTPGVDDIFDLKLDGMAPATRLAEPPSLSSSLLGALLPWLACLLGVFFLRSRSKSLADVDGRRSRSALREFEAALAGGKRPLDALCGYLADRLACEPAAVIGADLRERLQAAGVSSARASEVHGVIDRAVSARYSGQESSAGLGADAVRAVVRELEGVSWVAQTAKSLGRSVTWFLAAALCCGSGLVAQSGSSAGQHSAGQQSAGQNSAGETAYRARDYAVAAHAFAVEAEVIKAKHFKRIVEHMAVSVSVRPEPGPQGE